MRPLVVRTNMSILFNEEGHVHDTTYNAKGAYKQNVCWRDVYR